MECDRFEETGILFRVPEPLALLGFCDLADRWLGGHLIFYLVLIIVGFGI